jgi:hypothetical protein
MRWDPFCVLPWRLGAHTQQGAPLIRVKLRQLSSSEILAILRWQYQRTARLAFQGTMYSLSPVISHSQMIFRFLAKSEDGIMVREKLVKKEVT